MVSDIKEWRLRSVVRERRVWWEVLPEEFPVTITILHRAQLDTPLDACEVFCLHEMEGKLKEIGARDGNGKGHSAW